MTKRKKPSMLSQETQDFIAVHRNEDIRSLALQAKRYPNIDMREALSQIEGWQLAKEKLPQWAATEDVLYPPRLSMEQCSSQATAQYKATIAGGKQMADITGGFGIDCSYMARNFDKATYIERNSTLCDIAQHNFGLLNLNHITVINGQSEDIIDSLPRCNWIYADPARRDSNGGKVVALADCEPNIPLLEEKLMSKCDKAMIKCSPMLDITAACRELKHVSEVHVVAVNNECKELLFILSSKEIDASIPIHCINILKEGSQQFSSTMGEDYSTTYAQSIKEYLYEPNAAIQKGGCTDALTQSLDVKKLHPNSQLFTSSTHINEFPGRVFIVDGVSRFSKGEIKNMFGNIKKANITIRNFPDTVQGLRKRLKIDEGGDIYIFATTLFNKEKVLIKCHKA